MTPALLGLLALASAAGAVLRVLVDTGVRRAVARRRARSTTPPTDPPVPWGIAVVNLTGAAALGLLTGLVSEAGTVGPDVSAVLGVGLLGSYTTFSTLVVDAVRLRAGGRGLTAAAVVALSGVLGVALAAAGWWVGAALWIGASL